MDENTTPDEMNPMTGGAEGDDAPAAPDAAPMEGGDDMDSHDDDSAEESSDDGAEGGDDASEGEEAA